MRSPRTWLFHVDVDIQDSGASLSHGPECTVRRFFFLCFVCVCVCARARVSFFCIWIECSCKHLCTVGVKDRHTANDEEQPNKSERHRIAAHCLSAYRRAENIWIHALGPNTRRHRPSLQRGISVARLAMRP
jgi:hypothetical protein